MSTAEDETRIPAQAGREFPAMQAWEELHSRRGEGRHARLIKVSCPSCQSAGTPKDGCQDSWHSPTMRAITAVGYAGWYMAGGEHRPRPAGLCSDGIGCVNSCGSGCCSRQCRVCERLEGHAGPPCTACPDYSLWIIGRTGGGT